MIDHALPDIEAWVLYFTEVELPVLRHTQKALDELRAHADAANGRVIASVILQDPLMTLRVLSYLAEHRRKSQKTDIATIEGALMMIGTGPFFRDFDNIPLVEDQLKKYPRALLGLLKVIGRARQASGWAREWAIARHDLDADEITIAALLHDAAEMLMWCFSPELALRAARLQEMDTTLRSATAQQEVFGFALHDLQLALSHILGLPELLTTLMDHTIAQSPRVRNVALAVSLARHSANGWNDPALPDDFTGIEDLLHIDHDALMARLGLDISDI